MARAAAEAADEAGRYARIGARATPTDEAHASRRGPEAHVTRTRGGGMSRQRREVNQGEVTT